MQKVSINHFLFLLVFAAAIIIRFWNFESRVIYGPEQAMSLIVSGNYLREKPSLLGQPYFRETTDSHTLFSGAIFNYSLVPLQIITQYDPVKISYFFAFINLFTGLLIYYFVFRYGNKNTALISMTLFLFNAYMIYHSFFIWNYNYLPLIFVLIMFVFKSEFKKKVFIIGLLSGIGVSLQYLYLIPAIISLLILIVNSKTKFRTLLEFTIGAIIGNLPMVIFDLKHDLYHVKTLLNYFTDSLSFKNSDFEFQYYHFLYLWPIFSIFIGFLLFKMFSKYKYITFFLLIIYLFVNLKSEKTNFNESTGMPPGLTVSDILLAAEKIAEDNPQNFNIAETYDFDTQAHVLRYPLIYVHHKIPVSKNNYTNLNSLYVLSELDYNYSDPLPWEIKSHIPYKTEMFYKINEKWAIFKLNKSLQS